MHIQQYCLKERIFFFPSFFPFPISLSLSLQFSFLLSYYLVLIKLLNLGGMGPSLLNFINGSNSMIALCFFWTLDLCYCPLCVASGCVAVLSSRVCNKTCYSPLKLLHALLSTSFDVLQLWMSITAVKSVDISLQLEVAGRDLSDRQKWN